MFAARSKRNNRPLVPNHERNHKSTKPYPNPEIELSVSKKREESNHPINVRRTGLWTLSDRPVGKGSHLRRLGVADRSRCNPRTNHRRSHLSPRESWPRARWDRWRLRQNSPSPRTTSADRLARAHNSLEWQACARPWTNFTRAESWAFWTTEWWSMMQELDNWRMVEQQPCYLSLCKLTTFLPFCCYSFIVKYSSCFVQAEQYLPSGA